jgi:plastocyanin
MARRLLAVLTVLLSVGAIGFVAGCGDDDDEGDDSAATSAATTAETTADTGGGETSVSMTEYEFDPDDLSVASGDTLELTNEGELPHNLTIVEGEPTGGGAEVAASDDIPGGDSGTLTVDAEPGDYGMLCTIPGHAEQGMTGTVAVE